jgi:hypothetical protein
VLGDAGINLDMTPFQMLEVIRVPGVRFECRMIPCAELGGRS